MNNAQSKFFIKYTYSLKKLKKFEYLILNIFIFNNNFFILSKDLNFNVNINSIFFKYSLNILRIFRVKSYLSLQITIFFN